LEPGADRATALAEWGLAPAEIEELAAVGAIALHDAAV
jgi:hypothetical protein